MVKINKKQITTISDKGVDGLYTITMADGSKIKCTKEEQEKITQNSTEGDTEGDTEENVKGDFIEIQ